MSFARFDACILDMDGLLLDTERVIAEAWLEAAHSMGFAVDRADIVATIGLDQTQTFALLHRKYGDDFPVEEIRRNRDKVVEERYFTSGIPVKPGAKELIALLKAQAIPRAVATSTRVERAVSFLSRTEILSDLDALVCTNEVSRPKPAPDIYLEAARRLKVRPETCLVLEDSAPGITAAHRAGMIPILIPDLGNVPEESRALAVAVYGSLLEVLPLVGRATDLPSTAP